MWHEPRWPRFPERALAHARPADHPVCRRPARQGAVQPKPVKMQRPAGRTILTGLGWSAGLVPWSTADGMIRLCPQPATRSRCVSDHPGAGVPHRRESAFRPSRREHWLHRWYLEGRCGLSSALEEFVHMPVTNNKDGSLRKGNIAAFPSGLIAQVIRKCELERGPLSRFA